jgi:hypothetical protein
MANDVTLLPKDLLGIPNSDSRPAAPIRPNIQALPYGGISWQFFELLCCRLLWKDSELRGARRYGTQGSEQQGIDIFSYRPQKAKFTVCQSKNVAVFGPALIEGAVDEFLAGDWVSKSDRFILAMLDSTKTTARDDAIAECTVKLDAKGLELEVWDSGVLDTKLKDHPDLVADFFGDAYCEAFCGVRWHQLAEQGQLPESNGPTDQERQRVLTLIEGLTK